MPGGFVTGALATGPTSAALVGKLPAHGDFIRRGDDAAFVARLDRWLETELGRVDPAGLDVRLATMPAWRFVLPDAGGTFAGALVASRDRVGREFPLLGAVRVEGAGEAACSAMEAALLVARQGEADAAATLAALHAAVLSSMAEERPVMPGRWWYEGDAIDGDTLPTGATFDRLLGPAPVENGETRP